MEDKNDLNDILVKDEEKEKDNNVKNILLFVAIVLLIFFIGILAFKLIGGNPAEKKVVVKKEKVDKRNNVFEELPAGPDEEDVAKENLDEMIKKIKESKIKEEQKTEQVVNTPEVKEADAKIPEPKKSVKITPTLTKKAMPKEAETTKPKTAPKVTKSEKAFYIQVASLSKYAPNKLFLDQITKAGFKYKVVNRVINGNLIKRVYVGPFNSRKEANKHLPTVKKKITASAFVIRD